VIDVFPRTKVLTETDIFLSLVHLCRCQVDLVLSEQREVEVGEGAERVDVEAIQFVDRFAAAELLGHECFEQRVVLDAGRCDQTGVRGEAGAELAERGNYRQQIHQGSVIVKLAARGILTTCYRRSCGNVCPRSSGCAGHALMA
jgi:hypothetical protein